MAKAKRAKYVSKGQRRNSRIHKPHARAITGSLDNVMRTAFSNAQVLGDHTNGAYRDLVDTCVHALKKPQRLSDDAKRGWSAHLSFRTYNELKAQGIMQ